MNKLSVVLATKNEETNIGPCLESVKDLADEIVVYDEFSTDRTRDIAKRYGARVFKYKHKTNFHQTKQRAINRASGDWILQLDADERVTAKLAKEIISVINMDLDISHHPEYLKNGVILPYPVPHNSYPTKLFSRHQRLIEQREEINHPVGVRMDSRGVDAEREVAAFFIPRLNFFLGAPLRHAGVYPDGIIRLFKKGHARLPAKSVHELMEVDGEVGWLGSDLEHHDSPTFSRYLDRANRYTDLIAEEFKVKKVPVNLYYMFLYTVHRPLFTFLSLYIRHRGFLDGTRGFIWSAFSALRFPIAYFKYYQSVKK